jgi:hypothetical protein
MIISISATAALRWRDRCSKSEGLKSCETSLSMLVLRDACYGR